MTKEAYCVRKTFIGGRLYNKGDRASSEVFDREGNLRSKNFKLRTGRGGVASKQMAPAQAATLHGISKEGSTNTSDLVSRMYNVEGPAAHVGTIGSQEDNKVPEATLAEELAAGEGKMSTGDSFDFSQQG